MGEKLMALDFIPTCSCPDFQKRALKNLYSPYLSNQVDRNWQYSHAGIETGQYCKHIWATLISKNLLDQVEIPNDLRIPESPQLPKQYNIVGSVDIRRGDKFY